MKALVDNTARPFPNLLLLLRQFEPTVYVGGEVLFPHYYSFFATVAASARRRPLPQQTSLKIAPEQLLKTS